jgi:hypothetical protein
MKERRKKQIPVVFILDLPRGFLSDIRTSYFLSSEAIIQTITA